MRQNYLQTIPARLARGERAPLACILLLLALVLAGCGSSTPSLPSGVYKSQQYHFSVTYPAGWQPNTSERPGAPAPLIVIITRSGSTAVSGSLLSSLTIDVLAMSQASVAQSAAALSQNGTLSPTTIGGVSGYADKPTTETGSGSTSAETITHTDFYVVHGAYLYQISEDALTGDSAALDAMVKSIKFS